MRKACKGERNPGHIPSTGNRVGLLCGEGEAAYRLEAEPVSVQTEPAASEKKKLGYSPTYETRPFKISP